jgi:leader peptidase (prepilin peptidase) / N-methyltransferase
MIPATVVLLGIFGLMLGSFLNVCISRLPRGQSIVRPGSHCFSCNTPIRWYDNIPVVSFLVLRGRCRACREPYSPRYLFVELITGIVIALFATDLETQRLPNVLTFPGIALGLLFSLWLPPGIQSSVIGAALGASVLLGIRWLWKRATGVDAMGLGDVKMMAMIGAFLGWQQVLLVLFLSSISGSVIGGLLMLRGRSAQSRLPFGTFLALSAFVATLLGDAIVNWYVGLYK